MSAMRIRKSLLIMLSVLLTLAMSGAAVAKQDVLIEIFYSSAWHDVSSRWRVTKGEIVINHGAGNEQFGVVPSDASLTFDNRDGEMNPDNRKSSLFGLIGHNTPIRIKVGSDTRFSGQIVSWKPRRAVGTIDTLNGRGDAWVNVQAQGTIRRLGQGTPPVLSAPVRTIPGTSPVAFWAMEAGSGATAFSSVLSGGAPMPVTAGATPGASSPVDWIPAMAGLTITPGATGEMSATIVGAQQTGDIAFGFAYQLVSGAETFFGNVVHTTNGLRWQLYIDDVFDELVLQVLDSSGPISGVGGWSAALVDGELHHVMATVEQSGADATVAIYVDGAAISLSGSTISTVTVAAPTLAEIDWLPGTPPPTQEPGELRIGSLAVWDTLPTPATISNAIQGWAGEKAGDRADRLCDEEGIAFTIVGTAAETQLMGPQPPATTLNLLDEIAKTDAGIIHDTRSQLGLTFRTGRSLYNQ